jgi:ppGpp synthetase/RelA/SpoT-type nucleotidyltranferase
MTDKFEKFSKKLDESSKVFNRKIQNIEKKIDNNIINEKESLNLFDEIRENYRDFLKNIFGDESNLRDKGIAKEIVEYNYSFPNRYSDAILFTYWSPQGDPQRTSTEEIGSWRGNTYYKGYRWSYPDKKKYFYYFFDKIKKALGGEAPVDFFTRYCITSEIRYLKIIDDSFGDDIVDDTTIKIPVYNTQNKRDCIASAQLKHLLTCFTELKQHNDNETAVAEIEKKYPELLTDTECLEQYIEDIYMEDKNQFLFDEWVELILKNSQLRNTLRKQFENCETDADEIIKKNIFRVVLAFQFYDHPYVINLFFPNCDEEDRIERNMCSLVITLAHDNPINQRYIKKLKNLANTLRRVPELDFKVWNKRSTLIPLEWKWKNLYGNYYNKFERMKNIAFSICETICIEKKISYFALPNRVKKFDSFFNKIVDYANKRREISNRNNTGHVLTAKEFRSYIMEPTNENVKRILNIMKDICGIRIILFYKDQVKHIINSFEKLEESKNGSQDINIEGKVEYDDKYGYRSCHIIFSLGKKRSDIYEFKDLFEEKIKCEVQVRTILEQGWADISHELFYKSGLSEIKAKLFKNENKRDMEDQARSIISLDDNFCNIRKKYEEFLIKYGIIFEEMN